MAMSYTLIEQKRGPESDMGMVCIQFIMHVDMQQSHRNQDAELLRAILSGELLLGKNVYTCAHK